MKSSPSVSKTRNKAVWGRNALIAVFLASLAVFSVSADAGPAKDQASNKSTRKQHAKLDRELNKLADGIGDSDVIVEFNDDSDSALRITANGGRPGRKLGIIKARAGAHLECAAQAPRG